MIRVGLKHLAKYTITAMEKRVVSWAEFGRLAEDLVLKIEVSDRIYDLVIGVARGGIPTALEIANRLSTKIDFINIKSYLNENTRHKPQILSTVSEKIEGRRILVVDDIVDSGDTMKTVVEWLGQKEPNVVETAALFVKPWSNFTPTYTVGIVKEWIIFPWEEPLEH